MSARGGAGTSVAVVGGGVSGVNVARLLTRRGVDVTLLEARDRLGGRVLSVGASGASERGGFDLGPSWVWPERQPAVAQLVDELGIACFPQRSVGDVIFERMSREPAQRYRSVSQGTVSARIVGGVTALVDALAADVADAIVLGANVRELRIGDGDVEIGYDDPAGERQSIRAAQVVLALPPRLIASRLALTPEPDAQSRALWRSTPTWMAGQAKFFAVYDHPFWAENGLSGTAQSMVGPMPEIHDATTSSGEAALLGFVGVGPQERAALGEAELTRQCLAQLARIFGPRAAEPRSTFMKDWATDPLTATADDLASSGHPEPASAWVAGPWVDRLVLAGSETSPHEGGYLAGAIEASSLAADEVLRRLS
ncbi:MAG: flavin monoamine oxidase family protein [Microbacterium sp.]|uniref:flavin monoamine oxidase family protein n=1 Tax=Microbacterium sp. TaxID=51671 RepID=UPI003D6F701D